jgi:hypothetical protein
MPGRGNGLQASSYTPLTDLEPRLADAMLEALKDEGVAAYVVPATQASAGLTMKEFRGPLDRLWVDAKAKPQAQRVLDARLPALREELEHAPGSTGGAADQAPAELVDTDEQAAWAEIVAFFNDSPSDPVPRWPAAEDIEVIGDDTGDRPPARPARGTGTAEAEDADAAGQDGIGPEAEPRGDRDEDHFVPPPPPPLPRADAVTKAAWAALLGGPLYLFVAAATGMTIEGWEAVLAAGAFVGGFVTLVARMGDRPPTDSGPDDGAVV